MSEYVKVPVVPTVKMIAAGKAALSMAGGEFREHSAEEKIRNIWPAMVGAALSESGDQGQGAG